MRNSSPVALGQVIANKYQVEGVLGEGGMGIVVSAWHLGLDQRVAIKLLLSHMRQSDSSALERFQREARAAARIRSEHVCRVLDTGHLDDGTPYLVMEYLEGADLCDELIRRGRFEIGEAVRYVREACQALQQAHNAGVIHRDLKPANLYLVQRPDGTRTIKVLDFGVSKSISTTGVPNLTLTKTSALVGSPIYMSPEQLASSKDVDHRTDVWALGTILYELITGRTPFYGETIPQLVNAVLNTEPEPFANLGVQVPAGLEQVVRRALSKQRDGRYATAHEMFLALAPYASDDQGSISGVQVPRTPLPTRSMNEPNRSQPPVPAAQTPAITDPPRKKQMATPLLIVLLVALAGVAAVLSRLVNSDRPEATQAAPTPPTAGSQTPAQTPPATPEPPKAAALTVPTPTLAEPGDAAIAPLAQDPQAAPVSPVISKVEEARASKERSHSKRETVKAPEPASKNVEKSSATDEDGLSNFGGRR